MSKAKAPKVAPAGKLEYVPTDAELEVLKGHLAKSKAKLRSPSLRVLKVGKAPPTIVVEHQDQAIGAILLKEAVGTIDSDFLNGLLKQIVNIGSQGSTPDESGMNFVLSVIKGIGPKDQVETMLAAQMAAVHVASMTFARRLGHVENIPQQDAAERAFNKLTRTFAMQMETLKRYRTGGQQKVTVEHVTVNKGGQAIVGNVRQTTAPAKKAEGESSVPPALADQSGAAFDMELKPTAAKEPAKRRG